MAGTDIIYVTKQYVDPVTSVNTNGVEERVTLSAFMNLLPAAGSSIAGSQVLVTRQTAPAAAPAAFADLTAAATAYNAMRSALIAAGVFV